MQDSSILRQVSPLCNLSNIIINLIVVNVIRFFCFSLQRIIIR